MTIVVSVVVAILVLASGGIILHHQSQPQPTSSNGGDSPVKAQKQTEQKKQGQSTTPELAPSEQLTYPVKVYFSKHPESDDNPSRTFAVARVAPDLGVGNYAIADLLKGPTQDEAAQRYFSYTKLRSDVSNCNGADFTLSISAGVATLQFCKTFDHIGSVSDGQAESEIKATLKQFSSVEKVIILNKNGDCEFNLSGLNLCKQ